MVMTQSRILCAVRGVAHPPCFSGSLSSQPGPSSSSTLLPPPLIPRKTSAKSSGLLAFFKAVS